MGQSAGEEGTSSSPSRDNSTIWVVPGERSIDESPDMPQCFGLLPLAADGSAVVAELEPVMAELGMVGPIYPDEFGIGGQVTHVRQDIARIGHPIVGAVDFQDRQLPVGQRNIAWVGSAD